MSVAQARRRCQDAIAIDPLRDDHSEIPCRQFAHYTRPCGSAMSQGHQNVASALNGDAVPPGI